MNLCACDLCFGFVPPFPLATFFALLSLHLFHHIQEQVTFSHLRIHPSKCILLMVMWLRVNCRLWVIPSPKSPNCLSISSCCFPSPTVACPRAIISHIGFEARSQETFLVPAPYRSPTCLSHLLIQRREPLDLQPLGFAAFLNSGKTVFIPGLPPYLPNSTTTLPHNEQLMGLTQPKCHQLVMQSN